MPELSFKKRPGLGPLRVAQAMLEIDISRLSASGVFVSDVTLGYVNRLMHITGFATTLESYGDTRPRFFARYRHVQRVVWVSQLLADLWNVELGRVERLAWLHDLNRWPFAHNGEQKIFDQSKDVERFLIELRQAGEQIEPDEAKDLALFHHKKLEGMSKPGRCVLLADMLTGLVEDPMMATVGLNLHPEFVPTGIRDRLGWNDKAEFETIYGLCLSLRRPSFQDKTLDDFNDAFKRSVSRVLESVDEETEDLPQATYDAARRVKDEFLRPQVFPINNEFVCHGSRIQTHLVQPFISQEKDAKLEMTRLNEPQFIQTARKRLGLSEDQVVLAYPSLDFVTNKMSARAFVDRPAT